MNDTIFMGYFDFGFLWILQNNLKTKSEDLIKIPE